MTTLHPLIERLIDRHGASLVTRASLDGTLARPGTWALFFSGDPVRFPECLDVAVVLPELQAACPPSFSIGVVARDDEDAVARAWGVRRWPSLVFVRDGGYLATVAGLLDWSDYVAAVADALRRTASRPPTIGIPVVGDPAGAASACAG